MSKRNILVTSYPKSGATWFRFLIYVCRHGKLENSMDVRRYYPQLIDKNILEKRLKQKDNLYIKSHHPYTTDIPHLDKMDQCIYIVRNPFDILASLLNHYIIEGNKQVETEEGKRKFIRKMINNANSGSYVINPNHVAGGWSNHVLSWINENQTMPVYLIKYEELRTDTYNVLRKANRDLNLGFNLGNIKLACEYTSFPQMKKLEKQEMTNRVPGMFFSEKRLAALKAKNKQFVNKGKIANYKSEMPRGLLELGKKSYAEAMNVVKYAFDADGKLIY